MNFNKFFKIVFFFLIFFSNIVKAEQKIVYIDMDFIMNNSLAGKSISKQINDINQVNLKAFKESEENLRSDENKILKQKNVINEEEYRKKVVQLKERIVDYNKQKKIKINNLTKKKISAQAILINSLTPILAEYSKENLITMIVSKKNIIIGKKELDITKDILKIVNTKITNVNLK
tara:strand:+ start:447 stop:974 length:528 start_codon:yes stop_codon:yes gene_type:complete